MQLLGIGTDLIDLARFRNARNLKRVAEYILTPAELAFMQTSRDDVQYLASRFAVKEAVIKACPTHLTYHDITVRKDGKKPIAAFVRKEHAHLAAFISLAHTADYATACANVYHV